MKTTSLRTSFHCEIVFWVLCFSFLFQLQAQPTAPKLLPFQGRLTDQNSVAVSNGVRLVQFKIFSVPTGGSPVWAGELHRTTVNGGLVNVLLGSKTPFTGVDFDQQLYLEITVDINADNSITLADPPMLPRQSIMPVVFAKEAADSRLLAGHDWTPVFGTNDPTIPMPASKLADGSLPGSKIQSGTITATQVADAVIGSNKLAPDSVTSSKIAPLSILDSHVASLSHLTTSGSPPTNAVLVDALGNVGVGVASPGSKLDVGGRILRNGLPLSSGGSTTNNGVVTVPWGTTNDWTIFVSPRRMGHFEQNSENDNALLMMECYAAGRDTTSWNIVARYRWKWVNAMPNGEGEVVNGEANYLLVPR